MELHLSTVKNTNTIGAQLIYNKTLIEQSAINCADSRESAMEYIIDKYKDSHGAFDVFINGTTLSLV